jgi:hypothetical protein
VRAITIHPGEQVPDLETTTVVITEDVKMGERRIRKGHRLVTNDIPSLVTLDRPVHAVVLEPGDVHEDDAGARLAAAVAGPGLTIRGPSFSRYNLVADDEGSPASRFRPSVAAQPPSWSGHLHPRGQDPRRAR